MLGCKPSRLFAAEVTGYRIVAGALANVQRHAHARHSEVPLEANGSLKLELRDDGASLRETYHAGFNLTSMRERAVELGETCVISLMRGDKLPASYFNSWTVERISSEFSGFLCKVQFLV